MHDCPTCKVPLHGYEEVCPSCGTRQRVRKSYGNLLKGQQKPSVNVMPFVIVIVVLGLAVFAFAKTSWIGKLMDRGPVEEDPLDKMSWMEARQTLYSKIESGLASVGAKGKYSWKAADKEVDINAQGPVDLSIETTLPDPNMRRQIIDPVKDLMNKAQIPTLVMNDTKSRATWTYNVQLPPAQAPEEDPIAEMRKKKQLEAQQAAQPQYAPPQQTYQPPAQQYQPPAQQQAAQPAYQEPVQQQYQQPPQQAPEQHSAATNKMLEDIREYTGEDK